MKRRNFLVGVGGTAVGGSALIGSGAFSRVESNRAVSIEVAPDPQAYLGMSPIETPNSTNYVKLDGNGHIEIDIDESNNDGYGVNSNSTTTFDGMLELCNNGKADAEISLGFDGHMAEGAEVFFYSHDSDGTVFDTLELGNPDDSATLGLGSCVLVGVKTKTHGVSAYQELGLLDGTVTVIADAPGAGELNGGE